MKFCHLMATVAVIAPASVVAQDSNTLDMSNVTYDGSSPSDGQTALTAAIQILLDRAGISPGVIDGTMNPLTEGAISAFESQQNLDVDGQMDDAVWSALGGSNADDYLQDYTVTAEDTDVRGEEFPTDYTELAELDYMGFVTTQEKIAEEFHMSQELLAALNGDASFSEGDTIRVVAPGSAASGDVAKIEVRKSEQRVVALDGSGAVIASYPAVVGSDENPSPSGAMQVAAIAVEPTYSYRPTENFQQGDNSEPLTLPPGPNGPVGIAWIDLSEPTYGIHGANDPSQIASRTSHGCVRILNWDVMELAQMITAGVEVSFVEQDGSVSSEVNGSDREDNGGQPNGSDQSNSADQSDGSDQSDTADQSDSSEQSDGSDQSDAADQSDSLDQSDSADQSDSNSN